ncbi:MAG: hypothetical protein V1754_11385 [Pseudomonadota bacterium]
MAGIYAIHIGLIAHALPFEVLLSDQPFDGTDYQTHYQQTSTISDMVDQFGKFWGYDPNLLAGQPAGLIFDVDNKFHFLFTYGLTKLGMTRPIAFKLFTLLSCLLAPLSILWAAMLFRLGSKAVLIAFAFSVLLWHFDYSARFVWIVGMVSFATASHISILVTALFFRLMEERQWRFWIWLAIMLPLSLLIHVWAFGILVVPMVCLYLKSRSRKLGVVGHLQVWSLVGIALVVNAYWFFPALRFFYFVSPSGIVGQTNPLYFLSDWLELLINPFNTGFAAPHTLFRFVVLCGAVVSLYQWRKEKEDRYFVGVICLVWTFGMAYVAALIPGLKETEPYRFVIPGILFAAIFSAPWIAEILSVEFFQGLSSRTKVVLCVLMILLFPRVADQILYFIPALSPETMPHPILVNQARLPSTFTVPPLDGNKPTLLYKRLHSINERTRELARYVQQDLKEDGRVLVQHWAVGEFLRWATDKPIIGGFPDRRIRHEAANIFHRYDDQRFAGKKLADYLVRYNVRYVIMTDPVGDLEKRLELLEPLKLMLPHRIYRVRHFGNYFVKGSGRVKAGLNRIEVEDARPAKGTESVVLRFHHMETLRCRPNCRVKKETIPYDPIGFVAVMGDPKLPRTFVVEHQY